MRPIDALQATLAGEHAAVYLYGVLGAQTSETAQPVLFGQVSEGFLLHRRRRDDLTSAIAARGARPVASEVSYVLPSALTTPALVRAAALQVESRLAVVYGQLVGSSAGATRRFGIVALTECAVRQLALGGAPETFPGSPA